ncbi:non-specific lipid-transfer protein 1-like [Diospyros lotus]|uniref:non-specific lipid-transfer protein 1-like n=1 Tax=Diospyros lotus TaxID=55363 RepID=UPI0022570D33|nr:non-specific lipid-transfer protein 1-like [Diospyros lotus]
MKRAVAIALVAVLATVQMVARPADAAIDCGQVQSGLSPCIPYLTGGGNPAGSCCQGVRHLASMVTSKEDRRAACQCAKDAANSFQNIKDDAAAQLPGKCGVQLNVPISRTIDCSGLN